MSLYLRYRPQSFSELRGQDHIRETLRQAVAQGRTTHAYLLAGPRGIGKTSTARILAKALNCQNLKDGDPCNKCEVCRSITEGRAIDLIEIDAASNRGIDEIRELREKARFTPSSLKYKVFIIDEAHMLTKEAFNALLKTLEEPPEHAVFILATTEPYRLPETIISRCQRYDFGRVANEEIVARLREISEQEKLEAEEGVLEVVAEHVQGGFRDAIGLLDQLQAATADGRLTRELLGRLVPLEAEAAAVGLIEAIAKHSLISGLAGLRTYIERGGQSRVLVRELLRLVRLLLLAKVQETETLSEEAEGRQALIRELASSFEIRDLLRLASSFQEAGERREDILPGLWLELALIRLIPEEERAPRQKMDRPKKSTSGEGLEQFSERWSEITERLKERNHGLSACLQVATPIGISGEVLELSFPYKFHRERVSELKNRRTVEEVISEVMGAPYRIECLLGEVPPAADKEEDLVRATLEILGGEVIK